MKMGGCPDSALPNEMFCQTCKTEMEREVAGMMVHEPSSRPADKSEEEFRNPPQSSGPGSDFQLMEFLNQKIDEKFEELKLFILETLSRKVSKTK
jgi:hypothetical protein